MIKAAEKIASGRDLQNRLQDLPRPLVFTNGCFDILHRGHVTYLEQAAELGASLMVAVNSDASVRRLGKDGDRPVNQVDDRMAVLAALASVDLVVEFDEDTPMKLIMAVRPDHLVKGGDWSLNRIVGADFVISNGGQVHSIPIEHHVSSSDIISRIQDQT